MKKLLLLGMMGLLSISIFAQRVRTIDTDTATYFIDTVTYSSVWGGATFNGQQYVGTNTGAYSQSDGYGNTTLIVSVLGTGAYAAYRCDTLVLNSKQDWSLPSGDESKMIYKALNPQNIFAPGWYWTSSDYDAKPYTNFSPFDTYAWKKWFGGGEGDIYELAPKIYSYSSFCISKEKKVTTVVTDSKIAENESYKLYDINGLETQKTPNTVLIKKYESGRVEKVVYAE